MTKTVAEKMGIKAGSRAIFVNAPATALEAIGLPGLDIATNLSGKFSYIHLFAISQEQLDDMFPRLKNHLGPKGMMWVSWPKNRQLNTDLTLPEVIKIGYSYGLVESTTLSVDNTWSAIKFTHPIEGKVYNNSYGKLSQGAQERAADE